MASPEFLSSVFVNWEGELLQIATYLVFTAPLIQRGSAGSEDPGAPARQQSCTQARFGSTFSYGLWELFWRPRS
ncbi:DUF6766 family protein [Novosphingobium sp. ZW T3_23]|uniref:DUF6766 family protein n=1 Tax=Novosphingobium sp. ZW T3_23 TaxID=3378084 RepID=UPI003853AEAD